MTEDIIRLKAEVFDLIAERDRIQNEINKRMVAIATAAKKTEIPPSTA